MAWRHVRIVACGVNHSFGGAGYGEMEQMQLKIERTTLVDSEYSTATDYSKQA